MGQEAGHVAAWGMRPIKGREEGAAGGPRKVDKGRAESAPIYLCHCFHVRMKGGQAAASAFSSWRHAVAGGVRMKE